MFQPKMLDPLKFIRRCWPHITIYKEQKEILYSIRDVRETIVPAAHEVGKDFIAALACLWFFVSREPARVVTTAPSAGQLEDVLWGEIRRFIDASRVKLPIRYTHMKITQKRKDGSRHPLSEFVGRVVNKEESLLGRHATDQDETSLEEMFEQDKWKLDTDDVPRTLICCDEVSGCPDWVYHKTSSWAHRLLAIGNPYPTTNFFFRFTEEGDKTLKGKSDLFRKIIRIKAEHSPNVRLAQAEIAAKQEPSKRVLIPGVVSWSVYQERLEVWDEHMIAVGLNAEFYKGSEIFMYPSKWLSRAEELHQQRILNGFYGPRRYLGCDPAEGGDDTSWTVIDDFGIIEQIEKKTTDTSEIYNQTVALINKHSIDPHYVVFDRGGGGKQHADYLRRNGYKVRTVGFGESVKDKYRFRAGRKRVDQKVEREEEAYTYKDRRAEMYHYIRLLIDPVFNPEGFAIPVELTELRRQMSLIPLEYDINGKIFILPKSASRDKSGKENENERTLKQLIGRSPDQLESLICAGYAKSNKKKAKLRPLMTGK